MIPKIILENKYYIGDTVLLEPIARTLKSYLNSEILISSKYPEILDNNPEILGIDLNTPYPQGSVVIDMSKSIRSYEINNGKVVVNTNKISGMYSEAGLNNIEHIKPKIYLTEKEFEINDKLLSCFPPYKNIGIALESRNAAKTFPYIKDVINRLSRNYANIFLYAQELKEDLRWVLKTPNTHLIIGQNLRAAIQWISLMDIMIGPDTGLMHIAGALSIPLVVIISPEWKDLYSIYDSVKTISPNNAGRFALKTVSPKKIIKEVELIEPNKDERILKIRNNFRIESRKNKIALFRLDGLGGSITLSDHAKKLYDKYGFKSSVIIRNNKEIFEDNPYIDEVILVGHVNWDECLHQMAQEFGIIGEIRFALCKWHQFKFRLFEQNFSELDGIFDAFPLDYNQLEVHGLHHIQLTDKYIDLPYDTIDSAVYSFTKPSIQLPEDYIIINNGVDALYKGRRQTKSWNGWDDLSNNTDLPYVQVGTEYDMKISKSMDLRGKLSISELFWVLKNAKVVISGEGGITHASYACDSKNVMVVRGPTTGKLFEYPNHQMIDSYVCSNCWSTTADWFMKCPKNINNICMDSIGWKRVAYHLERVLNEDMV